jgi:hypothetical protein
MVVRILFFLLLAFSGISQELSVDAAINLYQKGEIDKEDFISVIRNADKPQTQNALALELSRNYVKDNYAGDPNADIVGVLSGAYKVIEWFIDSDRQGLFANVNFFKCKKDNFYKEAGKYYIENFHPEIHAMISKE